MSLLKQQRNQLFNRIVGMELDPAEFEWDGATLRHKPSGFYFSILQPVSTMFGTSSGWGMQCSPGNNMTEAAIGGLSTWEELVAIFAAWLVYLTNEVSAPDYWDQLRFETEIALGTAVENTPFTADERAAIETTLSSVVEYARAQDLEPGQLDTLEANVEFLIEASKRMNRFDWRGLVYGVFLTSAVQSVLPPDFVRQALNLIGHGIAHMFGVPLPEIPAVLG